MAENTNDTGELTDAHLEELEELASKLEEAWKKGGAVDLAALLPASESPLRKPALIELIKVDLECRWRKGRTDSLETYIDKFPELGRPRDLPAKLVFEEYRVRHLWGDKPALAQYQKRFPGQFPQLQTFLTEEPLPTEVNDGTLGKIPPKTNKDTAETNAALNTVPKAQGYKDNTQQVGEYRMIERLGAGAFGEVWKVELPGGILKAVKVIFRPLDHDEAKRELESLELIKGLRHHFLLQTISFKPSEDRLRILMDLADGSLRDLLKQAKKEGRMGLPLVDIAKWIHQAAEALDYLHERKMQHRDIKPENILLSEGNVRVADFGLARQQQTRRLASGSGAGTPLYMPPEAWNDKQHANSDQYSLAATYAECRLGRRIYESEGLSSLMNAHLHDKPKLDPLPKEEQAVLMKALAKKPEHRYPSCVAFADDLQLAVAKHLPPGTFKGLPFDPGLSVAGRRARQKQKQIQTTILVVGFFALIVMGAIIASLWAPKPSVVDNHQKNMHLPTAGAAGPFRPVKDTEVVVLAGKHFYKQIECPLDSAPDLVVRFNLIPWTEMGKQSFYLMENKVSNQVYEAFAAANPSAVNGSRWRLGAREQTESKIPTPVYATAALFAGPPLHLNFAATRVLVEPRKLAFVSQEDWPHPRDFGVRDKDRPLWPVLRVDIQEAHLCAAWFGGALPSAEQWDRAAGRDEPDRGDGPFISPFAPGEIAIDREDVGPLPVGTAGKDVCKFSGCRDMAGNGQEWTRTFILDSGPKEYFGDVSKVLPLAKVPLRGRRYQSDTPLTYAYLDRTPVELDFFEGDREASSVMDIGFRIALMP